MKNAKLTLSELGLLFALSLQHAAAQNTINIAPPDQAVPAASADAIVRFVFNLLIIVALLISLIFLIYGGIKWITSGGDKTAVESARNTVVAAIVGLVIVLLTWVIINFVLQLLGLGGLGVINIPNL